jgi:voltage-dependent calcium channel L type alpha-1D
MKGLSIESDKPYEQELINYGITTFDNLGVGFITIFQMITLEGWVNIMYNLMDTGMPWMAVVFCITVVIVCSFFLLNVILAILSESIQNVDLEDPQENKRKEMIAKSINRARKQIE